MDAIDLAGVPAVPLDWTAADAAGALATLRQLCALHSDLIKHEFQSRVARMARGQGGPTARVPIPSDLQARLLDFGILANDMAAPSQEEQLPWGALEAKEAEVCRTVAGGCPGTLGTLLLAPTGEIVQAWNVRSSLEYAGLRFEYTRVPLSSEGTLNPAEGRWGWFAEGDRLWLISCTDLTNEQALRQLYLSARQAADSGLLAA